MNLYTEAALFVSIGGLVGALYGAAFNVYLAAETSVPSEEVTPTAVVVPMAVVPPPVAPLVTSTPRPTVPPPSRAAAISAVPGVRTTPSPSAVP